MGKAISRENIQASSNTEDDQPSFCHICGGEPICEGLGVIRYDVPVGDARFGKLFRCPNNPVELDIERHERLRRISNLNAYAGKTFENFVIDPNALTLPQEQSLQFAVNMALNFANNPDGWLLLKGGYGCGKTHLAAAIGNERLKKGDIVLFITVPDLLDHLRSTYGPSSEVPYDDMFDRIRNAPLLILDDLGAENASSWAKEKLFQLFNHRYSRRLPTIVTTNTDVDTLDARIRSRLLDESLIHHATITAPDYRTSMPNRNDRLFSSLNLYRNMSFETFNRSDAGRKMPLTQDEKRNLERVYNAALSYAQRPDGWFIINGAFGS
ncbi:ATP-binding protein, partial [bacterium]|nr:ATP-binding protein [bacterium]